MGIVEFQGANCQGIRIYAREIVETQFFVVSSLRAERIAALRVNGLVGYACKRDETLLALHVSIACKTDKALYEIPCLCNA